MVLYNYVCFSSVPIPFKADRLNLKGDERWSRVVAQTHEQRIIWADNVQKLNRKDGKVKHCPPLNSAHRELSNEYACEGSGILDKPTIELSSLRALQ